MLYLECEPVPTFKLWQLPAVVMLEMVPPASTSVQEFPFMSVVASFFLFCIVCFEASLVLKKMSFIDGSAYLHPTCCICQVCELPPDMSKEPPHSGSSPSSNDLKWV